VKFFFLYLSNAHFIRAKVLF